MDPLLFDMSVGRNLYHCLPWEYSGRDPAVWRGVYRWLESLLGEAVETVDREERAGGGSGDEEESPAPFKKKNPFNR